MAILYLILLATACVNEALKQKSTVNPLEKATTLLEDLRQKLNTEQEAEAQTYDKFACFCKDVTAQKLAAIDEGQAEKDDLQARLNEASTDRDAEDAALAAAVQSIREKQNELDQLQATRHAEGLEYEKSEVDLTGAVQALTAAIHALNAAKTATTSLAQLQANGQIDIVRRALLMAELLNPTAARKASASLIALQQPFDVPSSTYEFHADDIISTLEDLKTDFKNKKDELTQQETAAKHLYDTQVLDVQNSIGTLTDTVNTHKKNKAEKDALIEKHSQDLTTTSAQLLDDQAYASDLSAKCHSKALLWDQRTQLRADELQALTKALEVMRSSVVSGPGSPEPSFLQLSSRRLSRAPRPQLTSKAPKSGGIGRRARATALLRSRARALKSALLLRVAGQASADPFAKVKQLIQELIERLLTQAEEEANHKGWCDHEVTLAEQGRDSNAAAIKELNSKLAVEEARREQLSEMIQTLNTEIHDLSNELNRTEVLRQQETSENKIAIEDAKAAQVAVEEAIRLLSEFYGTAANADFSLLGVDNVSASPVNDMPDAGFDSVYQGSQAAGGGVIAMLEVVASDFARTVSDTEEAEKAAEQAFYELQKTSGASVAAKTQAKQERTTALNDADEEYDDDVNALKGHQASLDKALNELDALHDACFDGGMTAEERKAKREEEIGALKQALCILDSGSDGAINC